MMKVHGLRVTINITYPRSGHHLLVNLLQHYFQERLVYSGIQLQFAHRLLLQGEGINFLHEHDHTDFVSKFPQNHYLIQIRYPLECLVSDFYLNLMHPSQSTKDTREVWEEFAKERLELWVTFYKKWVLAEDLPNRLVLNYADLIEHPGECMRHAIRFISDEEPTPEALQKLLKVEAIERKNDFRQFKYYDEDFFHHLKERLMIHRLPGLDLAQDKLLLPHPLQILKA